MTEVLKMLPEADLGHSFSLYGPTLIFFFQALKRKKTHLSVTVTVVRDRKLRTALRTNQIVGFVTVPAWKKLKTCTAFSQIEMHRSYPDVDFLFCQNEVS